MLYCYGQKFTYTLQNLQNVNNFNKIIEIVKIVCVCVCLISNGLNQLHFTGVYILRIRQH